MHERFVMVDDVWCGRQNRSFRVRVIARPSGGRVPCQRIDEDGLPLPGRPLQPETEQFLEDCMLIERGGKAVTHG